MLALTQDIEQTPSPITSLANTLLAKAMDSQPPNDPNRNNPLNNVGRGAEKEQPFDGQNRRNGGDDSMDVIGDLRESPAVIMMFLMGVASWFLREKCMC